MIIDNFMPICNFKETHEVVVKANPDRVFHAIKELKPQEVSIFRILLGIRTLPARLVGNDVFNFGYQQPLLNQMLEAGFIQLDENPNEELVFGLIGQFWKFCLDHPTQVDSAQDFLEFNCKNYAKVITNFYINQSDNRDSNSVILSTETRIHVPDPIAKIKFAIYWMLIYQGSSLIRRRWLKAIKCRAEEY